MKKVLILKSLAAGLAMYAAAGFIGVPYVIKNILPEKIYDAANGARFSVESAFFNPFTFHLRVKEIMLRTPVDGDLFAMKHFALNIDPLAYLWRGEWLIKNIVLTEPEITIKRDEHGEFNFSFLDAREPEKTEEGPSKPLKLMIKRMSLRDGSVGYYDISEGKAYTLGIGPIGFRLDNIDLRDLSVAEGKIRLYATINGSGFVDVKGKIDALSPLKIGGSVAFDSGKLYTLWSYFREKFPIEVADGKAAFAFDYRFDSSDVNATELSNLILNVNRVRIIPKGEKQNIFTMGSLRLQDGNVFPMTKRFKAESIAVSGVGANITRAADGTIDWLRYIEEIQQAFPEDENETKVPWQYRVGHVSIEGAGAQWNDDAPAVPYRMSLANIRLQTGVVDSDPKATLTLSADADTIRMVRQADGAAVAVIGALGIEGVALNREGHFADIVNVSILSPEVAFKRLKDGSLDMTRYVYASSKKEEPQEESAPWGYRIGEIGVKEGKVAFRDEVPRRNVALNVDQMNVVFRDFQNNPEVKNTFSLDGRLEGKSTFAARGDFVRSSLRSRGTFEVAHVNLALADPYIEPSTYASLRRGDLSIAGEYAYSPDKAAVKGKLSLRDWVVNDSRDDSVLLGWQRIGATPFAYAYPDNRLKINQLAIDGLYTNALIDANKVLNYSTLSKKAPGKSGQSKKTSSNPFGLDVVKLLVRNSSANFSDLSLPLPFKTYIHDLEGSVMGISTTKDVATFVKLRGAVDQYGLARIDGSLNTADPKKFTDIKVVFENLDLPHYTPYSLQFLGYHIEGGKLFLNLEYKIDQGALKGKNQVVIRQIELGEEKEGGSPWPMRLVVALLEDSDGVIDVDLPIQGDVNNPEFKYGKVVWQVITNLFTKAVTSPFRLLGSLLGIEDNSLSTINFEGGSTVLLPPQVEKLDNIVTLMHKRPKLALEVFGGWDEVEDVYALKGKKLVAEALKLDKKLKADSPNAIPLDILEEMAEESLERKERKALQKELEAAYPEEAAYVRHYSAALIEKLIVLQPLDPKELKVLGSLRAEAIRAHLAQSPGMASRTIVKEAEKSAANDSKEVAIRLNIIVP